MSACSLCAAEEYQANPELTAFEAFGEDDLHGESASSEPLRGAPPRPTRG
jgi:hypothetical protein